VRKCGVFHYVFTGNILPVLFLLSSKKSTFCPLAEKKNYELDPKMDVTF